MFTSFTGDAKVSGSPSEDIQIKNTNRMHVAVAGGAQPVKSGAWYFETRCVSGCAVVGWAANGNKKSVTASNGDVFYVDFSKNQIVGGRNRLRTGRIQVNTGDIIGSMIDFDNRSVSFSFNGEFASDMCLRGADLTCPDGYCPVVELRAGCSACVSVVASSFIAGLPRGVVAYGDAGKAPSASSSAASSGLNEVFDKYSLKSSPNKCNEDELLELFKAAGEESDSDPIAFVLLWVVNKTSHEWEVSRDNFVKAFSDAGCKNIGDIKKYLRKTLNSLLTHKGDSWTSFYKFVFHLLTENGSRMVNAEKAAGVWEVLGFKDWKFFSQWVEFVTEQQQKREEEVSKRPPTAKPMDPALIGLDVWQSFPQFVGEYPKSLDSYDMDDLCYNTLFGDFVEKVRGK